MWTYRGDEPTVRRWLDQIMTEHEGRLVAARQAERKLRVLGGLTVALAVGAAIAAAANILFEESLAVQVLATGLATVAAVSAVALTVLGHPGAAADHRRAAVQYADLRRRLEHAILSEHITDERLADIRTEWRRLDESSRTLPARVRRTVQESLATDEPTPPPAPEPALPELEPATASSSEPDSDENRPAGELTTA